jgi:hypothetical protein
MEAKTAEEILRKHVPDKCFWEDMKNLVNCPQGYPIAAMEEYSTQQNSELKEELQLMTQERDHWFEHAKELREEYQTKLSALQEELEREKEKVRQHKQMVDPIIEWGQSAEARMPL